MLPTPDTPKPLTPREPVQPPTALGMERPLAPPVVPRRRTCILEGLPDPWEALGVGRDLTVRLGVVEDLPEVTLAVRLRPQWEARPGPTQAVTEPYINREDYVHDRPTTRGSMI